MNVLRNKILQLRKENNLSWETWAEMSLRTVETLKKQVGDEANPTVSTLNGILAPLHASVEVLTDDEREKLGQADILRERVDALEKLLADARRDRDVLDMQISHLTETNNSLVEQRKAQQEMIIKLEYRLDKKDEAIARKDAAIASMLRKSGAFE